MVSNPVKLVSGNKAEVLREGVLYTFSMDALGQIKDADSEILIDTDSRPTRFHRNAARRQAAAAIRDFRRRSAAKAVEAAKSRELSETKPQPQQLHFLNFPTPTPGHRMFSRKRPSS